MGNRALQGFYLVIAVAALVATGWHNGSYFSAAGLDLVVYVQAALANSASTALVLDLFLVGAAAQVFMVVEGRRVGLRWVALVPILVGSFAIAIAFTFPLFLILRSRALQAAQRESLRVTI